MIFLKIHRLPLSIYLPPLRTISRSNNTSLRVDKRGGFNQFGNSFNRASTEIPLYNKVSIGE